MILVVVVIGVAARGRRRRLLHVTIFFTRININIFVLDGSRTRATFRQAQLEMVLNAQQQNIFQRFGLIQHVR